MKTKQKPEIADIEIEVKPEHQVHQKNTNGHLGPICNNCAGFGFTLGIAGRDHGCNYCNQTGVASMSNAELQAKYIEVATKLDALKSIIVKAMEDKASE